MDRLVNLPPLLLILVSGLQEIWDLHAEVSGLWGTCDWVRGCEFFGLLQDIVIRCDCFGITGYLSHLKSL